MADFVASHRLTEEASLRMLAAGVAKANELGCTVSLAVVDQSCRLIAFLMMDGARHFSIITTQRKAITAASQRLPTGYAPEENALSMSVRMGDFTNVPGGFPDHGRRRGRWRGRRWRRQDRAGRNGGAGGAGGDRSDRPVTSWPQLPMRPACSSTGFQRAVSASMYWFSCSTDIVSPPR